VNFAALFSMHEVVDGVEQFLSNIEGATAAMDALNFDLEHDLHEATFWLFANSDGAEGLVIDADVDFQALVAIAKQVLPDGISLNDSNARTESPTYMLVNNLKAGVRSANITEHAGNIVIADIPANLLNTAIQTAETGTSAFYSDGFIKSHIDLVDTSNHIWYLTDYRKTYPDVQSTTAEPKPVVEYGGVRFERSISGKIGRIYASDKDAGTAKTNAESYFEAMHDVVTQILPERNILYKSFMDNLKIERSGKLLIFTFSLSEQELLEVLEGVEQLRGF
jgi:hypothetical protein